MSDPSGVTLQTPPVPPETQGQPEPNNYFPPMTTPGQPPAPGRTFSEEDIQRARTEEREKLYRDREAERQELARLRAEKEERDRQIAEAQQQANDAAEAERHRKEAEELDAKTLIERRDTEYQQKLAERDAYFQAELDKRDALLAKERQFAALAEYRNQAMAANSEIILPELLDLVGGNTETEIDASVQRLAERSASVMQNLRAVGNEQRRVAPGISPRAPAVGPDSMVEGQRTFSAEDINNWSLEEYAQYRSQLGPGRSSQNDQGMFR